MRGLTRDRHSDGFNHSIQMYIYIRVCCPWVANISRMARNGLNARVDPESPHFSLLKRHQDQTIWYTMKHGEKGIRNVIPGGKHGGEGGECHKKCNDCF
jgi:hypothetical protein